MKNNPLTGMPGLEDLIASISKEIPDLEGPTFDVPGMTIKFETFVDAIQAPIAAKAFLMALENNPGMILRFDAVTGESLKGAYPNLLADGMIFAPTGYYGIVHDLFAIGPFERKSQAMNGLALAIAGVPVTPDLGEKLKAEEEQQPGSVDALVESFKRLRERLDEPKKTTWEDIIDVSAIPEEAREEALAEAIQGFVALGITDPADAEAKGMSAQIVLKD